MAKIELSDNEFMERFVSEDHIDSHDDRFWYEILSCSFNFMRVQDPKTVDKVLDPYLVRLTLSNSKSLNIGSLVRVFLDRVSKIKSQNGQSTNPYYVFQSFNALYLIRTICKSYIENLSEEQMIKAFRSQVDPKPNPMPNIPKTEAPFPPPTTLQTQQQPSNLSGQYVQHSIANSAVPGEEPSSSQTLDPLRNLTATKSDIDSNLSQDQASTPTAAQTPKVVQIPEQDQKIEITTGLTMLDQFISALISIIVDLPLTDSTYPLQVESINSLIVLLSVQMFSKNSTDTSVVYNCLMRKKCSIHALILTKTLLYNFVNQKTQPEESGSIIIGLASGIWRVLTLGYGGNNEDESETMPLLAKQSILLLNVLINHYSSSANPYREAIISCQDSNFNLYGPQTAANPVDNEALAAATTSQSVLSSNSFKIKFHDLYETICKHLYDDQVTLLLYPLLRSNQIFRSYIMTTESTKLDRLVLPMLKILHNSIERGSYHVYMILILFIMLTEEKSFNETVHKIHVYGVPWYRDRAFSDITLGSLTTLIMVRSIQVNALRIKDRFLHSNLFAVLANLSNQFDDLHPYVCQRLVDLLERLSKRYLASTKPAKSDKDVSASGPYQFMGNSDNPLAKALATDTQKQSIRDASSLELDSSLKQNGNNSQISNGNSINTPMQQADLIQGTSGDGTYNVSSQNTLFQERSSPSQTSDQVSISMDDVKIDLNLLEVVIRMVLEIINNCLSSKLKSNPNLIYTLLYKRRVFSSLLSSHESFYDLVITIERTLTFFFNKIEASERSLTESEIKEIIQASCIEWDQIRAPDTPTHLLFRYVEDEDPEEFFIPYIWTKIFYSSGIPWNSKRITLFNPYEV